MSACPELSLSVPWDTHLQNPIESYLDAQDRRTLKLLGVTSSHFRIVIMGLHE